MLLPSFFEIWIESSPIVLDSQGDHLICNQEGDDHSSGLCMFEAIVHRFLDDSKEVDLLFRRKILWDRFDLMFDLNLTRIADLIEHALNGFRQAESIDLVGAEIVGNTSDFLD